MVGRLWHGYTTLENADAYELILRREVIPEIASMRIDGFLGIQVLRRPLDDEIEFVTLMWFSSEDKIKGFTGEDYERAHVPDKAKAVLKRYDERSAHYEIVESLDYE